MLTINTDNKTVVEVTAATIETAKAKVSRNSRCSLLSFDVSHDEPSHQRMSDRRTSNQVPRTYSYHETNEGEHFNISSNEITSRRPEPHTKK